MVQIKGISGHVEQAWMIIYDDTVLNYKQLCAKPEFFITYAMKGAFN